MPLAFSHETIASIAGIVLSLVFAYVPGLADKFAALDSNAKRLIMAVLLLIVTAGMVANACRADGACYAASAEQAIRIFIAALLANQGAFLLAPRRAR